MNIPPLPAAAAGSRLKRRQAPGLTSPSRCHTSMLLPSSSDVGRVTTTAAASSKQQAATRLSLHTIALHFTHALNRPDPREIGMNYQYDADGHKVTCTYTYAFRSVQTVEVANCKCEGT